MQIRGDHEILQSAIFDYWPPDSAGGGWYGSSRTAAPSVAPLIPS